LILITNELGFKENRGETKLSAFLSHHTETWMTTPEGGANNGIAKAHMKLGTKKSATAEARNCDAARNYISSLLKT